MVTNTAHGWRFYLGTGLLWPVALPLVYSILGSDAPQNWSEMVHGLAIAWMFQFIAGSAAFLAVWLAALLFVPTVGFSPAHVARLFCWTSLILSPLAFILIIA